MNNITPESQSTTQRDEEQLIAFHLCEPCNEKDIRSRLEVDLGFAALSESISKTLRAFSAEPVEPPDTTAAWLRLRPFLPVLEPKRAARSWRLLDFRLVAACVLLIFGAIFFMSRFHRTSVRPNAASILRVPAGASHSQEVMNHMDRAERWLTAVNHTSEPLGAETRVEGDRLLLNNAVYLNDARSRGDLPDAVAMERLNRVLTAAHHTSAGFALRMEMNTDGLLFDLRILRQNKELTGDLQ